MCFGYAVVLCRLDERVRVFIRVLSRVRLFARTRRQRKKRENERGDKVGFRFHRVLLTSV